MNKANALLTENTLQALCSKVPCVEGNRADKAEGCAFCSCNGVKLVGSVVLGSKTHETSSEIEAFYKVPHLFFIEAL